MHNTPLRTLGLLLALAGAATLAQAQQEQARVISSTPIVEAGHTVGYNVTYEYAGRRYTTQTEAPPGRTIPIQISPYGVATSPVAPQPPMEAAPLEGGSGDPWQNVVPEQGVVVGAGGAVAAPAYGPPPVVYAPPVYVQPAYAWPQPYVYPPVGISLGIGYSRGWHRGGWYGGGWRGGWR